MTDAPVQRTADPKVTYAELHGGSCPKGGEHQTFIGLTADCPAPAWCVKCGARAYDVPAEVYENI